MFRKFLSGVNFLVWLATFLVMFTASFTSVPSNEPLNVNILLLIASILTLLFMVLSAVNTIPMFTTEDIPPKLEIADLELVMSGSYRSVRNQVPPCIV
jgi:protein-S-isoprenylcysteine O-methyltransferase Ste14